MKHTFYICTKTNWQGDNWEIAAGPFGSRKEAEDHKHVHEYRHIGQFGLDLKSETHARVFSKSQLSRYQIEDYYQRED